jgi:hypothetical protein
MQNIPIQKKSCDGDHQYVSVVVASTLRGHPIRQDRCMHCNHPKNPLEIPEDQHLKQSSH